MKANCKVEHEFEIPLREEAETPTILRLDTRRKNSQSRVSEKKRKGHSHSESLPGVDQPCIHSFQANSWIVFVPIFCG